MPKHEKRLVSPYNRRKRYSLLGDLGKRLGVLAFLGTG